MYPGRERSWGTLGMSAITKTVTLTPARCPGHVHVPPTCLEQPEQFIDGGAAPRRCCPQTRRLTPGSAPGCGGSSRAQISPPEGCVRHAACEVGQAQQGRPGAGARHLKDAVHELGGGLRGAPPAAGAVVEPALPPVRRGAAVKDLRVQQVGRLADHPVLQAVRPVKPAPGARLLSSLRATMATRWQLGNTSETACCLPSSRC